MIKLERSICLNRNYVMLQIFDFRLGVIGTVIEPNPFNRFNKRRIV